MKNTNKNLFYKKSVFFILSAGFFVSEGAWADVFTNVTISPRQRSWVKFIDENYGNSGASEAKKMLDIWNIRVSDKTSSNYGKPILSKCTIAQETNSSGMCEFYFRSSQPVATDYLGFPGLPKAPGAFGSSRLGTGSDASTGCINAKGSTQSEYWYGLNSTAVTDGLPEQGQSIEKALKNALIGAIADPNDLCGLLADAPTPGKFKGTDIFGKSTSSGERPAFVKNSTGKLLTYMGDFYYLNLPSGVDISNLMPSTRALYCTTGSLAGNSASSAPLANIIDTFTSSLSKGNSAAGSNQFQGQTLQTMSTNDEEFSNLMCPSMMSGSFYANVVRANQNYAYFIYFNETFSNGQLDAPRTLVYESVGGAGTLRGYKVKASLCTSSGKTGTCFVPVDSYKNSIRANPSSQSANLPLLLSSNGVAISSLSGFIGSGLNAGSLADYTTGSGSSFFVSKSSSFQTTVEIATAQAANTD